MIDIGLILIGKQLVNTIANPQNEFEEQLQ